MRFTIYTLTAFFLLLTFFPADANAQRRDYLTDEEIELVREAQQADLRIEVLVKAIDRRFMVLNNDPTMAKKVEKDIEMWGDIPKGTRQQLVSDISKILRKAVDDIDDIAAREGGMDSKFFPKAMNKLTEAAQRFLPQFKSELDKVTSDKERGSVLTAIDLCNQIIEASAKVPKEVPKEKKKKN